MVKKEVIKFMLVGCGNTLVGVAVIYGLYDICGCGYWSSSAIGYLTASIWSYCMNKKFTFRYKKNDIASVVKFAVNVAGCYVISYSIAKPAALHIGNWLLPQVSGEMLEKAALLLGMFLFTVLNFIGQKFFCFKKA